MRFVIIGAGAMGCLIGGKLQQAQHEVAYLARGAQLEALQRDGLTLETEGERWHAPVAASDDATKLGPADTILMTTKAYQLASVTQHLLPLLHKDTVIVPMTNGVPWWYFFKQHGPHRDRRLETLDPEGILARSIPIERVVGGVNYLAGTLTAPGRVWYVNELARRLVIGELDGAITPRLVRIGDALDDAGFAARRAEDIRQAIWHKLWGNMAFNPVSALTHATQDGIAAGIAQADGTQDHALMYGLMEEGRAVAHALGITLDQTIEARIAAAAKMKGHRTSMDSDMRASKPTEIEAILGVVLEIARWYEVATPRLSTLYHLVRLKEETQAASFARAASGQA